MKSAVGTVESVDWASGHVVMDGTSTAVAVTLPRHCHPNPDERVCLHRIGSGWCVTGILRPWEAT